MKSSHQRGAGPQRLALGVITPLLIAIVVLLGASALRADVASAASTTESDRIETAVIPAAETTGVSVVDAPVLNQQTGCDLALTKTANVTSVNIGGTITYTLRVQNIGTAVCGSVTLTDALDQGVTLTTAVPFTQAGWNCNAGTNSGGQTVLTCTRGSSPVGMDNNVRFTVRTTACGPQDNTATVVRQSGTEANTANNTSEVGPITVNCPQLTITKAVDRDGLTTPVVPGNSLLYTVTVTNTGAAPATGVQITDQVAPTLTVIGTPSVTGGSGFNPCVVGTKTAAGTLVSCPGSTTPGGTLNAGATAVLKISVRVDVCTAPITNKATVTTTTPTANQAQSVESNTVSTTIKCPDLIVRKQARPTSVVSGNTATFEIQVFNQGAAATSAGSIVVSDPLPAGLSFVNASGANWACVGAPNLVCTWSGANIGFGPGNLGAAADAPNNATSLLTLTVSTPALNPGDPPREFRNCATVDPKNAIPESDETNNENCALLTVTPPSTAPTPDLSIVKRQDTGTVNIGQNQIWTITVKNNGTGTATNITVIDNLPVPQVTFIPPVVINPTTRGFTCTYTSPTVTCSGGTLLAGQQVTFTISAQVETCGDGTVKNKASVTYVDPTFITRGPVVSNEVSARVQPCSKLNVNKTINTTNPLQPGSSYQWTIKVTNNGNSALANVVLNDDWSADSIVNNAFTSVTTTKGTCNTPVQNGNPNLTCNIGVLAAGASATIKVNFSLATGSPEICNLINVATASGVDTGGNTVTGTDTVNSPLACADLIVTKTIDQTSLLPNMSATYTITIKNVGNAPANNLVLSDDWVPDSAISGIISATVTPPAQGSCPTQVVNGAPNVVCNLGNLAINATVTVTIKVGIAANPNTCLLTNTATATTSSGLVKKQTPTNPAQIKTPVACQSIGITKTANPTTVNLGDTVTYTITVPNGSDDVVGPISISDLIAAGQTVVSVTLTNPDLTGSCTQTPNDGATQVTCTGIQLQRGDSAILVIVVRMTRCGDFRNTASATLGQTTVTSTPATTVHVRCADLVIRKTGPEAVDISSNNGFDYTITVTNIGDFSAAPVEVIDHLPPGFIYDGFTGAGWTCVLLGTQQGSPPDAYQSGPHTEVKCTLGSALAPNGVTSFKITVSGLAPERTVTNQAVVDPDGDVTESNEQNNVASFTTLLTSGNLTTTKVCTPNPVNLGATTKCTITVTNSLGIGEFLGTLVDTIPAGTSIVPNTVVTGGNIIPFGCVIGAPGLNCTNGYIGAAPTGVLTVAYDLLVNTCGTKVNRVQVTQNPVVSYTINVNCPTISAFQKSGPQTVDTSGGASAQSYTISFNVSGSAPGGIPVGGVTITDTLPAGVTFVGPSPANWNCTGTTIVTCTNTVVIPNGAGVSFLLQVSFGTATTCGNAVNTAVFTSAAGITPPANATATTRVNCLAISVTKPNHDVNIDDVLKIVTITQAIIVANNSAGGHSATNVNLGDIWQGHNGGQGVIIGITPSQGTCSSTDQQILPTDDANLTCNFGTITAGSTATVTVTVQFSNPDGPNGRILREIATATYDQSPDATPANDTVQKDYDY